MSILMPESLVTVSMVWLLGTELSLVIGLHCSLKKTLNRFALSKKSVTNPLFTRRGGINGTFEPLTNVFTIDQLGSLSLIASLSWYLALDIVVFDNSSVILLKMAWSTVFDYFCFWNIAFSLLIRCLIFSFIQEGSRSHKIIVFGINLWKIFNMVWLNKITRSLIFLSKKRLTSQTDQLHN